MPGRLQQQSRPTSLEERAVPMPGTIGLQDLIIYVTVHDFFFAYIREENGLINISGKHGTR